MTRQTSSPIDAVDIRRLFDSITDIWILADIDGCTLLVSQHLEKFQHLLPAPVVPGRSLFDSVPGSWKALARNIAEALRASQTPSVLEASKELPDGRELSFEVKCSPIAGEGGKVTHIFIQARDVTPQKIFEKKITLVAREHQNVIENANAVIIGADVRGYITEWNAMAQQVIGYSKNESYIQRMVNFLQVEEYQAFTHSMHAVLAGEVIANWELRIRARSGKPLTLLINATPRRSGTGEVVGALFIGQDITELTTYREQLEQLVRERTNALKDALENERRLVEVKDRFVSMASHEFRSPISYIHRNIGLIREHVRELSADDIAERLGRIQTHAEHLTALLEDVLTIGKSGATQARIEARLKSVELGAFFRRIIDEVQTNTHHTHRIVLDFPYDSVAMETDENLLRNIFVNLLTNAIKFSPGRPEVFLSVAASGSSVTCRVTDRGIGIEEKELATIFEPFHRGSNVEGIKGTGLGLPIVKKAAETLGAILDVESEMGKGTTFTVKLNTQTT